MGRPGRLVRRPGLAKLLRSPAKCLTENPPSQTTVPAPAQNHIAGRLLSMSNTTPPRGTPFSSGHFEIYGANPNATPARRGDGSAASAADAEPTSGGGATQQPGPPVEPPTDDLSVVVGRMAALRVPGTEKPLFPERISKLSAHGLVASFKSILEEMGILKSEEPAVGQVNASFVWRPAFEYTVFFVDARPENLEAFARRETMLNLWGVHTAALASEMKARGYTQICADFPGTFSGLPPRLHAATRAPGEGASTSRTQFPIGCFKPTVDRRANAVRPSLQICRMFEDHTMSAEGTQFAPLYEWTLDARAQTKEWQEAEKKITSNISNHLNRYGHVYLYICSLEDGVEDASLMSLDDLKKNASVSFSKKTDDATPEGKKPRTASWFEQAATLAKSRVESVMSDA